MAKLLRHAATIWVMLFGIQLICALGSEFRPLEGFGDVLYPLYVGLDPWTVPNLMVNISLLAAALGSFFLAEKLEHEALMHEQLRWQRPRERAVRFSQ